MLKAVCAVILTIIALPALAVGKVSVDPNTPGAVVVEGAAPATDNRLLKKITGSAAQVTVAELLDAITKYEGVVLRAGRNSNDWQVRDRKMSIFSKGATLAELMNSISRVMKFKWERSGEPGKWTYRLYMDRRTLLDAEAQRVRMEEKRAAELAEKRANAFAKYTGLANLTPEEKAKLRTENPLLFLCAQAGVGQSFSSLCREVPAVADAVANGGTLEVSGDLLSPAGCASLKGLLHSMSIMDATFNAGSKNRVVPDDIDPKTLRISINPNSSGSSLSDEPGPYLGLAKFSYGNRSFDAPIPDPDGGMAKLLGKMIVEGDMQGRAPNELIGEHWAEFAAEMTKVIAADYGGEVINQHPSDPALDQKIDYTIGWPVLPAAEKNLAEKTKLSIVSDYFGGPGSPVGWIPGGQTTIKEALDRIGDTFIYNWDKRGGVIELRDRNWFKKRAAQIPEAWLEKWRKELKTTGRIELDNLSEIAQLTQEQYSANVAYDSTLRASNLSGVVTANREILRFYAALSSSQRSALTGSGLDIAALSADQADLFEKLLASKGKGALSPEQSALLTCARKQADKAISYTFSALVDNTSAGEWTVTIPTADPPAKKS